MLEPPLQRCPICSYPLEGLPEIHKCPECAFDYDKKMIVVEQSPQLLIILTLGFTFLLVGVVFGGSLRIGLLQLIFVPVGLVFNVIILWRFVRKQRNRAVVWPGGIIFTRGQRI